MQLLSRVLVPMLRFLTWGMGVVMRMLVRMAVFMSVGMQHTIGVTMFVGVNVRMDMRVRVVVFDWIRHDIFLLLKLMVEPWQVSPFELFYAAWRTKPKNTG